MTIVTRGRGIITIVIITIVSQIDVDHCSCSSTCLLPCLDFCCMPPRCRCIIQRGCGQVPARWQLPCLDPHRSITLCYTMLMHVA